MSVRTWIGSVSIVLTIAICLFLLAGMVRHRESGPGEIFLIPQGYTGWLILQWETPGTPVPKKEAGKPVFVFNKKGYCAVPTRIDTRWRPPEEGYYWDGTGRQPIQRAFMELADGMKNSKRVALWGGSDSVYKSVSGHDRPYSLYFVGNYKQYNDAGEQGYILTEEIIGRLK